ncbi:hypothetical protein ACGFNV_40605 [Streptomyces sp. NPDC048751]|uniref:hypothetical protein n=1 Tax=Streptomyces sp. NPDC048751 TaxID=3365591 RepID=UPI003720D419
MRYVLSTFVVMPKRWIDAYGWRRMSRQEIVASGAVTRAPLRRAVRLLPPRRAPHHAGQNREIKGYPDGYRLEELGTRPVPRVRGCPVRHVGESAAQ